MHLEVGTKFFSSYLESKCHLLETVYRLSALDRDLLKKNIGHYFQFSSSLNNAVLTEISETAK